MRSLLFAALLITAPAPALAGSAVFLHPDGMGANTWHAVRLIEAGPDGRIAWDGLPHVAVYVGPMADAVTASSNGGATSHAWGVRAQRGSFGMIDGKPIARAGSGADAPLMIEAKRAGKAIGIVNTASVTDAGTGVHLAQVPNRRMHQEIAAQMLAAGPDVMLGGGEQFFLPAGVRGAHGVGVRTDGRNLIEEARAAGYTIVRTREQLAALASGPRPKKVLGLFAAENTFLEGGEAHLKGRSAFRPEAPRYDEMVQAALALLQDAPNGFFLVAEEEATDNLGGDNNAAAVIEAARGADRAIAAVRGLAAQRSDLTVVVASDSDCGALQVGDADPETGRQPAKAENGAPADGVGGAGGTPFLSAPDRTGKRLPFRITWAEAGDVAGALVARGQGPGAAMLSGTVDSTDIYRSLRLGLFGPSEPIKP